MRVGEDGEPPMMTCLRLDRSCFVNSEWCSTALKIAGTARTRVTLCRSMAWMSASGSNLRSITCWPPIIVRKCGVPHPLTWKSGTTCKGDVVLGELQTDFGVEAGGGTARDVSSPRPWEARSYRSCRTAQRTAFSVDFGRQRVRRAAGKESLVFDLSDAVGRAFHDYETRLGRQLRNHGLDERLEVLVEEDDFEPAWPTM